MVKIVALVGSNRKESYNKKLVLFIQERYKNEVHIEILPIGDLPMYNQDDELALPSVVEEIKKKISESDGVLIATPEYNHSISGVLKNALDWFSRVNRSMMNKPVMIVGASMGELGTVRAQGHLRQILNAPGLSALVLPGNEVFIGNIHEKINTEGVLIHKPTINFIDKVMMNFIEWMDRVK
ncbi:MAG: NAD(P)H-dependent oxidoreductase [Epulopiscium sp.]|nr:NAD(P)H-dependent oxidoreductase [Candidatus Epulonipiscium sp.]